MFKNYLGLWLLLATAFLLTLAHSFFGPVNVLGIVLKQPHMDRAIVAGKPEVKKTIASGSGRAEKQPLKKSAKKVAKTDTAPKIIMLIGDSMLEGLSPRLAAYAQQNGHTLYTVMWYSSQTQAWGSSGKIASYVKQLHPDYIFICLGANELFVKDIKEKRRPYVQQMVKEIGDIPFVWIGPPNWKPDTGINELIAENVPDGSYFKSDGMHFDRSKDGAHPTRASAILWMDSVVRWMPRNAAHPIKMDKPAQNTGRPKKIFVHQPSEIQ